MDLSMAELVTPSGGFSIWNFYIIFTQFWRKKTFEPVQDFAQEWLGITDFQSW